MRGEEGRERKVRRLKVGVMRGEEGRERKFRRLKVGGRWRLRLGL